MDVGAAATIFPPGRWRQRFWLNQWLAVRQCDCVSSSKSEAGWAGAWQYESQVLPLGLPLKADRPERTSAPFTLVDDLPSLPS